MAYEQTFCLLKPGVLQRRIAGEVLSRIERKGLKLVALKMIQMDKELCEKQYQEHEGKPFYNDLVSYMQSGPVVTMVVAGENAISFMRTLAGATNPKEAAAGTIRGDYALITQNNIIHASDSPQSAAREIELFFAENDIHDYEDPNAGWISG